MGHLALKLPAGSSKEELRSEHYNATITSLERVHENLLVIRVTPDFALPEFEPGQFTSLGLGWWEDRVEGSGKDRLHELGDRLTAPEKTAAGGLAGRRDASLGEDEASAAFESEQEALAVEYGRLIRKLIKRAYSISDPILDEKGRFADLHGDNTLEFYLTVITNGGGGGGACPLLTPRLALLGEGDRIYLQEKISGLYTLNSLPKDADVVFAATGTGEAPHNAMIAKLLRGGHRGRIVSIVSARLRADLAYLDVHRRLEEAFANYAYAALTTRDLPPGEPKVYIQDFIRGGSLEELLGRPLGPDMHFFLCGNPAMVGAPKRVSGETVYPEAEGVVEILERRGPDFTSDPKNPERNIHFESYW